MSEYLYTMDLDSQMKELQKEKTDLADKVEEADCNLESLKATIMQGIIESNKDEIESAKAKLRAARQAMEVFVEGGKQEQLDELNRLQKEIPGWEDGDPLIPVDEWVDYVQDLLKDTGMIPGEGLAWFIDINWESTAENVAMDYITVEFGGKKYYARVQQ